MRSQTGAASRKISASEALLLKAGNDQIVDPDAEAHLIKLKTENQLRQIAGRKGTRRLVALSLLVGDLLALIVAFFAASIVRLGGIHATQVGTILAVSIPIYLMFSFNNNAHNARVIKNSATSIMRSLSAFALTAAVLMLIAFFLKIGAEFSRLLFGLGIVFSAGTLTLTRLGIARIVKRLTPDGLYANLCIYDRVPVKSAGRLSSIVATSLDLHADLGDSSFIKRLGEVAKGMDRIIIHCTPEHRDVWAKAVKSLDVPSEIVVPELDSLRPLAIGERSGHTSLLVGSGTLHWNQMILKRAFDIVVSLAAIVALSPLLIAIAILVKLDSKGPAIFKQERIGLGNRRFMIWKFRSMRTDMQDTKAAKLTERNDPRITRIGNFIRRTSIDELPQLFNVLRGEMSIVGPRPHAELAKAGKLLYWEVDNAYWLRHVVKPGITGLAQVRGHRGNTFEEGHLRDRLQSDLEYVAEWSIWTDARIVAQTVAVLFHKNAF